jgi:hypothetical protein
MIGGQLNQRNKMYEVRETKNFDHYMKVYRLRRTKETENHAIEHPLLGQSLIDSQSGKLYLIEKVVKHWLWGWYIALLIQNNGSHCLVRWENISSGDDLIIDGIEQNRKRYSLVKD